MRSTSLTGGIRAISIGFEEVAKEDWREQVWQPDIAGAPEGRLYKKPGYQM